MITAKNGNIIFENRAELNLKTKELVRKEVAKLIDEAKRKSTEEALTLILPMACNALYECYGFGEKRLEKFIDQFMLHMECLQDGVTGLDDYAKWCKDQGYKFIDVVEVQNE